MTKAEIEEAREAIQRRLQENCVSALLESDVMETVDALCAAARQPDSLVGRQVRSTRLGRGVVESGPLWKVSFRLGDSMTRSMDLVRDDFTLIDGETE